MNVLQIRNWPTLLLHRRARTDARVYSHRPKVAIFCVKCHGRHLTSNRKSDSINQCVFTWKTFPPTFIQIRFETVEARSIGFLKTVDRPNNKKNKKMNDMRSVPVFLWQISQMSSNFANCCIHSPPRRHISFYNYVRTVPCKNRNDFTEYSTASNMKSPHKNSSCYIR